MSHKPNLAVNQPAESQASTRSMPAWNNRILVVEDEREIGRLYQEILVNRPENVVSIKSSRRAAASTSLAPAGGEFEVVVVDNAEAAIAQVKQALASGRPFAMGFFDVLLGPGQDGIELAREILILDPSLYAVFVTAYQDRSVDAIGKLLGAGNVSHWDYLNKPFSGGEILQKARNFISLWNMTAEKVAREALLADAHRRLLEFERSTSVAAVARGVSHEFGNILMQIMGKADLGRRKPEAQMRESLERILDATHRATEILDRFKHLAHPAELKVERHDVHLPTLIDEAIDLMEHALKTGGVKVCKIKMDDVTVFGSTTSLLQVFVNLMINSIHAMNGGGQIDISVTKISDGVEIRVRDFGPGVKPELLDRVMEPFFTTKGEKGTGLGLAICREVIVIEHCGQFSVRNHPLKGFEAVIHLPVDPTREVDDAAG